MKKCRTLKPPYDQVACCYFYEELTTSQIAEKLNRNEKTVQTQVYRAKAMLKKMYERRGGMLIKEKMSDEQMEAFIAYIEENEMIQAPKNLKEKYFRNVKMKLPG